MQEPHLSVLEDGRLAILSHWHTYVPDMLDFFRYTFLVRLVVLIYVIFFKPGCYLVYISLLYSCISFSASGHIVRNDSAVCTFIHNN
jgi:hypothetical protein